MSFSNESGTAFAPYKFSSIPLQRNYGTHVTGNLLINSGELDIVVKPGFGEPDIPLIFTTVLLWLNLVWMVIMSM